MRIVIEEAPERIKRFGHVRPASRRRTVLCTVRCPGTSRACTLEKGHTGPHVAHDLFRRVVAVWDREAPRRASAITEARARKVAAPTRREPSIRRLLSLLLSFPRSLFSTEPTIEEVLLLVLSLCMVGFAIHWILLIFR